MKLQFSTLATALMLAAASTTAVQASSHREAPFVTEHPKVDATDFYLFRSYEPGREGYVTIVANYNPLQDPYGGPNYFSLSPDALYEIHIDNTGDAQEDLTFQFQFDQSLGGEGAGIALELGGKKVAVPLKQVGPVSAGNTAAQNFFETYQLTMVSGDRRSGQKMAVTHTQTGDSVFAKPLDNIGEKTFSEQSYEQYARSFIADVTLPACPESANTGRVFVGQRKDSFAVNLGPIFDLVNLNPLGPVDGGQDFLADKNVTTFALELPIACLAPDENKPVIAGWTSASLPQVRILNPDPDFKQPALSGGAWTQVSRLGMPLVNEVVIGLPDKNKFNASEPKDDTQFLDYVTNPTLPALLEILFGVSAPTAEGRPDLVAAFLTGLEGVNADGSVGEVMRLNTALPITEKAMQNNLGVAAGDVAGFPNGRRPGDDVTDVALRVAMGALCHLELGLCTPEDALSGDLPYTDGALQSADQFDAHFPYLTMPLPGATNP
ncbi:MAG: DUF4331 domain-containing protein [Thiotrichales bacterium]